MSVDSKNVWIWNRKQTINLLKIYEALPELWDPNNTAYKERRARSIALNNISRTLNVPVGEIRKKIHYLRCQFNSELRKIKKRSTEANTDESSVGSDWRFFDHMQFLMGIVVVNASPTVVFEKKSEVMESCDSPNSDKDASSEEEPSKPINKRNWEENETIAFIQMYQQLAVLWDPEHYDYKKRFRRTQALKKLSQTFNAPLQEVKRKIHNLRCQFTYQIRKLEKESGGQGIDETMVYCEWTYFQHMKFLLDIIRGSEYKHLITDTQDGLTSDEDYDVEYLEYESAQTSPKTTKRTSKPEIIYTTTTNDNIFQDQSSTFDDDHRIFGEYVASELRGLTDRNAKKLKLLIKKAIYDITEEEFNAENSMGVIKGEFE